MDSCVECKEPSPCACLVLFIDCLISPNPRPWAEFQTMVLVNELLEIARHIRPSSSQPLQEPPDWIRGRRTHGN